MISAIGVERSFSTENGRSFSKENRGRCLLPRMDVVVARRLVGDAIDDTHTQTQTLTQARTPHFEGIENARAVSPPTRICSLARKPNIVFSIYFFLLSSLDGIRIQYSH